MNYKESFYNIEIKKDNNGRTLVYNSNTTALCWFTPEVYKTFKNKDDIYENELLPDIIRLGFVVNSELDEVAKNDIARQNYLFNSNPSEMHYIIAPTMTCNMRCKYCFENDADINKTMSFEDADKVIDFIINQMNENPKLKKLYILWFGGEPCLASTLIIYISKKLIEFTDNKAIVFHATIISNGLLLNKQLARTFKAECKIRYAQITLDGLDETYAKTKKTNKESFYKVVNNIVDINDILGLNIRINVTSNNKNEILPLIKYLLDDKKLKNKIEIYLAHVREYSINDINGLFSVSEFQKFKRNITRKLIEDGYINSIEHTLRIRSLVSCASMQMMTAVIGPDLNLYRCVNCLGKPQYKIGTCTDGFFRNSLDNYFLNYQITDKCKQCKFLPMCGTGCREDQLLQKREVDCEAVKMKLITNILTYAEYKKKVNNKNINEHNLFIKC